MTSLLIRVACLLATLLPILLLAACDGAPPQQPAAYIDIARTRLYDTTQPCFMETLGDIPIKVIHGVVLIPARVNGVYTTGFLDTGADTTLITPELAAAAGLTTTASTSRLGVTGSFSYNEGSAATIEAGSLILRNAPHIGVYAFPGSHGTELGINLGADFLHGLDYDIDFAHNTIRVYRLGYCFGVDPPWANSWTRLFLSTGIRTDDGRLCDYFCSAGAARHVSLPVQFPGGVLPAEFDTGSSHSLLSWEGALQAGATRRELANDPPHPVIGMTAEKEEGRLHHFAQITIGNDVIHDVDILVRLQFDRRDDPMILGMDLIGKYHLWLSYSTNAIYLDSGVKRALTPPYNKPHLIGATTLPAYPRDGNGVSADMDVNCWVEIDGSLTGCAISNNTAGKNFADATMQWLTGPSPPFVQPAYENGRPIRQRHPWHVHLAPPGILFAPGVFFVPG